MANKMLMTAEKYIKPGDTAPNLAPFPETAAAHSPRGLWREWHALPKTVLKISTSIEPGLPDEAHLDALLSGAVLRWVDAPWKLPEGAGRVIPLPLALLGVVPLEAGRNKWRLPVWACTPLRRSGPVLDGLCIGHAETVRELLQKVPALSNQPIRWLVEELPLPEAEGLEIIRGTRPMPGQSQRFSPPYWYDWEAAARG